MVIYLAVLLLTLAGDQALKLWVLENMELYAARPLLPGLVELKYIQNTGGGWSILSDHTWLLTLMTAVVLVVLAVILARKIIRHPLGVWMAHILFAGGLGNLIDRIRLGYVVDMFDFQFMNYPVFNVADICVVIGVIGCAVYYIFLYEKYDAPKPPVEEETEDNGTADSDLQ